MLTGSHHDLIRAAATGLGAILVTGATGFTGGHLVHRLRKLGHHVRAFVRPGSNVQPLLDQGVEIFEGDLTKPEDLARAAEGIWKIFHIAAVFRTAGHPDSYYYDINVGGTENVLKAARRQGVERVIHCSTIGVHGDVSEVPSNEESPYKPGDIYQVSKLAGEKLAREAFADGLQGSVVRPASIYGPGDLRMLKLFRMVHNGRFRMFGSGDVFFHMVYIDDLVDGMLLCAERPEALGEVFIMAGPRYITLDEMVVLVAEAVGVPPPKGKLPLWPLMMAAAACEAVCKPLRVEPPLYRRRADFFRNNRAFSCEKARASLGYEPRIDPREGILRTARWYFEKGYLGGDLARQAS